MLIITGGSGFIGTRLCQALNNSQENFRIIDIEASSEFPGNLMLCDIRNLACLIEAFNGGQAIVHLAAMHRDDVSPKSLYFDVNVNGTKNICEAAEANGINKIIFTSSVACYGFPDSECGESAPLKPFNEYGKTKLLAEKILIDWQRKDPQTRHLVIVRPTVIFGENNRGNVFNLLQQISTNRFVMVGNGENKKSMAYVENVVAFLQHSLSFSPGIHCYNYVDKPDLDMNSLVMLARKSLGKSGRSIIRIPYCLGLLGGYAFDLLAKLSGCHFSISAIRVKKFCSNTQFTTAADSTNFKPPLSLSEGLLRTIRHEFGSKNNKSRIFYSE